MKKSETFHSNIPYKEEFEYFKTFDEAKDFYIHTHNVGIILGKIINGRDYISIMPPEKTEGDMWRVEVEFTICK